MAITEVNRKKGKGKKAIKKILKKGNTCKNRQKGGKKGMSHMIKCFILGEDGKIQDDGVSFTQGTLPDMQAIAESVKAQIKNNQNTKIESLKNTIEELKKTIKNLPAVQAAPASNAAQAGNAAQTQPDTTSAQQQPDTTPAPANTIQLDQAGTPSPVPTDALNNAISTVQQEQRETIEKFNNKKMKSIILLKQAYILKILALKNNVKKGTFNIEYNANTQNIELTYLDMLSINGKVENFKKYIGISDTDTIIIDNITLTIGNNITKKFGKLEEIIEFLKALENFNFNDLFTLEEINILNNSKGTTSTGGGKKRKYRRAIKKALKQKSMKGCVKININEKNKKRKKTFNRKIKIRNGSLRKK